MRLALATLLLFLMAGPARADDVFCVQKPGCVGTSEPSLGAAIAAADADADLDRIEIGPVTLAERDLEAMQPLAIVGSGPSTVIDGADSSTPDTWVLRLHTATASIRDLKIHQTQTTNVTNYGLITDGAAIENLDFEGTGDHIVTAISTAGSTTQVRHLKVTLPTAGAGYANALQMDGGIAEDLGLDAPRGVLGNGTVRRARIRSRDGGIFVWDAMTVEHSLIESGLHSPTSQNWGIAAQGGDGRPTSNVTVRNVTLLGHTGADSVGLMASTSTGGTDTINARNVIVRGFDHELGRDSHGTSGIGNIDIDWSDYDPSHPLENGSGTFTQGANNVNADPLFRDLDAFDLRLRGTSPLVDRGDPAPVAGSTDALGRPFPVGGRADIGGVEYQGGPVITAFTASPAVGVVGEPIDFAVTALSSADSPITGYSYDLDGDGVFEFDGVPITSTTRGYGTAGTRIVKVRVTTADGVVAERTIALTVEPAFGLLSFSFSRTRFRVGKRPTAISAAARKKKVGTTITYALTTPGTVVIQIARKVRGYRKGAACRVRRVRRARRCSVYVAAGSLTRASPAGGSSISFSGRIGTRKLKPGTYRASIAARNTAGRLSVRNPIAFVVLRAQLRRSTRATRTPSVPPRISAKPSTGPFVSR